MWPTLLSISSLLTGVAILVVGNGLFTTFMALRMTAEKFPTGAVGLVMSAYFVGLVWGSHRCVRIVEQVGHIRTFAALAALAAASVLLAGFIVTPIAWMAIRGLLGFAMAGLYMVTESWLNERSTPDIRGRVLSLYMMVSYLALGAGQLVLLVRPTEGMDHFMIAAMAFCLSLVPVALTRSSSPSPPTASTFGIRRLYRTSPLGVVGGVASGLVSSAIYSMGPVFATRLNFSTTEVSLFMSLIITSGLALQWPVGHLSDRYDRRTVIAIVAAASAAVSIGLILCQPSLKWALFSLAALFGGVSFPLYPLVVAHANDHVDPGDRTAASGGLLLIYGCGAIAGPILASTVMTWAGPRGLFIHVGTASVALSLFTAWRMTRRPAIPNAEQDAFIGLPRTTPTAMNLLPSQSTVPPPIVRRP